MPRKKKSVFRQEALFDTGKKPACPMEQSALFQIVGQAYDHAILPQFCRKNGLLYQQDCLTLMQHLPDGCIDLIFADPPYNIKKAEWDNFDSQEQYIQWSIEWIREASRILKSSGTLFICGFTEILADLKRPAMQYFHGCKWLIWYYKNKANLGSDWGRSHESIFLLRKSKEYVMNIDMVRIEYNRHTLKYPAHPQAESSQYGKNTEKYHKEWTPNPLGAKPKDVIEIPTTCNGMEEKTKHPTQKPEELLRKIILSASNPGDIVLDPFSGSGTTLVVSEQLGRKWLGCDISDEYNEWAINRIDHVVVKTVDEWIEFDRENMRRRLQIR